MPSYRPRAPVGLSASTPSASRRHPALLEQDQRASDQRACQATASPCPASEDAVQPAAVDAQRLVLQGMDGVDHTTGDLVAVVGDDPQRRIEVGWSIQRWRFSSEPSKPPQWSMNASTSASQICLIMSIVTGLTSRPSGKGTSGNRIGQLAVHLEEPSHLVEAGGAHQRVCSVLRSCVQLADGPLAVGLMRGGELARETDVLGQQRRADAFSAPLGQHRAVACDTRGRCRRWCRPSRARRSATGSPLISAIVTSRAGSKRSLGVRKRAVASSTESRAGTPSNSYSLLIDLDDRRHVALAGVGPQREALRQVVPGVGRIVDRW